MSNVLSTSESVYTLLILVPARGWMGCWGTCDRNNTTKTSCCYSCMHL